ncbi:MAG TPA: hypothetical protein VK469_22755 [Candidatus Kapabacteria bacterium]|nr:hypothetical protein [Candidatus Kapabacteria bacterium]
MGKENLKGEILIFGGAAMVLAFNSRPSTRDVDALFQPKSNFSQEIIFRNNKCFIPEEHNVIFYTGCPTDWNYVNLGRHIIWADTQVCPYGMAGVLRTISLTKNARRAPSFIIYSL